MLLLCHPCCAPPAASAVLLLLCYPCCAALAMLSLLTCSCHDIPVLLFLSCPCSAALLCCPAVLLMLCRSCCAAPTGLHWATPPWATPTIPQCHPGLCCGGPPSKSACSLGLVLYCLLHASRSSFDLVSFISNNEHGENAESMQVFRFSSMLRMRLRSCVCCTFSPR